MYGIIFTRHWGNSNILNQQHQSIVLSFLLYAVKIFKAVFFLKCITKCNIVISVTGSGWCFQHIVNSPFDKLHLHVQYICSAHRWHIQYHASSAIYCIKNLILTLWKRHLLSVQHVARRVILIGQCLGCERCHSTSMRQARSRISVCFLVRRIYNFCIFTGIDLFEIIP